ncbi:MAG: aminobenzoyl-glutamate transporter [Acidobacteria bacterium]|nr:MAG: aminobenzoyl-glutamate transporter [Acidobacteriota bacterium]
MKKTVIDKSLRLVEKAGNALPHPATLFALMAGSILILSLIASTLDWQAAYPSSGEVVHSVNLLNREGLHRILRETVSNFTSFAPLGIVIVAMLGIGIAESSGLISAGIRLLVLSAPKRILTFTLVFSGVLSNLASDVGYVLLVPLAGTIFISIKRHPIVGMAAAFAGVSGGFSANLFIGTVDPLLAGLSTEAAQIVDASYEVNPMGNWYFMAVSTFMIAFVGTWVTETFVAPRFDTYQGEQERLMELSPTEKKGLLLATLTCAALLLIMCLGLFLPGGIFRGTDGEILSSPLIKGVVTVLFIMSAAMGIVYGMVTGKYKNDSDVMVGMSETVKTLGMYIVLVFFAAQFVAYFKWTHLGIIFAIHGANALEASGLGLIPLVIMFILLSGCINMMMGSASAKWAIMAPVFIPMFMLLGYSPELTQVVYRIGDSVTNIISPMMSFFALIIAFFQKYEKDSGIGTIIATMLPYTIVFSIAWTLLLILWITLGIPLGPGAGLFYKAG